MKLLVFQLNIQNPQKQSFDFGEKKYSIKIKFSV